MGRPAHDPSLGADCGCFGCHIRTLQFDPRAMPNRRNSAPPAAANPAWERGVAGERRRDGSFMPFIEEKTMNPIGLKKFAEGRHHYEESIRRNRAPAPQE